MSKKVICTICARGGSKGVKNKNLKLLLGKPLIAHTIEQAKKSTLFELIAVSSDNEEILSISKEFGADVCIKRPSELASDTAPKLPAIHHCVKEAEKVTGYTFDIMVDLDATAPLRSVNDLQEALKLFESHSEAENLVSATPTKRSPYFDVVEPNQEGYINLSKCLKNNIVRRQDSPICYDLNASIYIWKRESFFNLFEAIGKKTIVYIMPEERSFDIDSNLDFEIVEYLAKKRVDLIGGE